MIEGSELPGVSSSPSSGAGREVGSTWSSSELVDGRVVGSSFGGVVVTGNTGTSLVTGGLVSESGGFSAVVVVDTEDCDAGIVLLGRTISFAGVNAFGVPPTLIYVHCSIKAS